MSPGTESQIRLVVLNYNGGAHLARCLTCLVALDWPADDLDVVVVDNASTDGSADSVEREFPTVRVIRNRANLGFPGNNTALGDLDGVRYVGLVNNDLFVEPGWLGPLVNALDADGGLGAASSRMLFAPRFVDVTLQTQWDAPGVGAALGVTLSGLRVDGVDQWSLAQFAPGSLIGIPPGDDPATDGVSRRVARHATLRVPLLPGAARDGEGVVAGVARDGESVAAGVARDGHCVAAGVIEVRVASQSPGTVTFDGGAEVVRAPVGPQPEWVRVAVKGVPYDIVNNVGSVVLRDGSGADRGYGEVDRGQYDHATEVFAWCGGSVLLRPEYLREVGLFDPRYFLYYEDVDVSWRGRAQGWRYCYVPDSVARHLHGASAGELSAVFHYHVQRNRLLTVTKNAPAPMVLRVLVRYVAVTLSYVRRDVLRPLLGGHRPRPLVVQRRLASFLGYLRLTPAMLAERRRLRKRQCVADTDLTAWFVPQPIGDPQ